MTKNKMGGGSKCRDLERIQTYIVIYLALFSVSLMAITQQKHKR